MSKQFPGVDIDAVHGGRMTVPTMMNCAHSESGWCLSCVTAMGNALREARGYVGNYLEGVDGAKELIEKIDAALAGTPLLYVSTPQWKPGGGDLRQVVWVDKQARYVGVFVGREQFILELPPLPGTPPSISNGD